MVALTTTFAACNSHGEKKETNANVSSKDSVFTVESDRFDDIQVLRYQVPGFNELSLKQKQLAYYLYQAGLSGRDIYYDQKYKHNLQVRKTLEAILTSYSGSKDADNYKKFLVYAKKFFFANGIHHHCGRADPRTRHPTLGGSSVLQRTWGPSPIPHRLPIRQSCGGYRCPARAAALSVGL